MALAIATTILGLLFIGYMVHREWTDCHREPEACDAPADAELRRLVAAKLGEKAPEFPLCYP